MVGALAGIALVARSRRRRAVLLAALAGAAVVIVPTRLAPPGWPPTGWVIVACDVGQGDAVVLATARPGWVVLVDAGPADGPIDACLARLGVRGIALVLLSHLHADHVGGLAGALRGRPVGAIAVGPVHEPAWALRDVARAAAAAGVPLVALTAGRRLAWPGLTLDVLGPAAPGRGRRPRRRHGGERRLARGAGHHPGGHDAAGGRRRAGRAGRSARHRAPCARGHPQDAPPRQPLQLARVPPAVGPRVVLVSVGAGNTYGQPNLPLLAGLEARGRGRAPYRYLGGRGRRRQPSRWRVGRAELQVVARGDPTPARRRRRRVGRWGGTGGGIRTRTVDHLKIVSPASWTTPATPPGYGRRARLRRPGPCGASPRARWRARCTAPPRSSPPGRSRTWSGSRRSPSCRTSASPRRRPRR